MGVIALWFLLSCSSVGSSTGCSAFVVMPLPGSPLCPCFGVSFAPALLWVVSFALMFFLLYHPSCPGIFLASPLPLPWCCLLRLLHCSVSLLWHCFLGVYHHYLNVFTVAPQTHHIIASVLAHSASMPSVVEMAGSGCVCHRAVADPLLHKFPLSPFTTETLTVMSNTVMDS